LRRLRRCEEGLPFALPANSTAVLPIWTAYDSVPHERPQENHSLRCKVGKLRTKGRPSLSGCTRRHRAYYVRLTPTTVAAFSHSRNATMTVLCEPFPHCGGGSAGYCLRPQSSTTSTARRCPCSGPTSSGITAGPIPTSRAS